MWFPLTPLPPPPTPTPTATATAATPTATATAATPTATATAATPTATGATATPTATATGATATATGATATPTPTPTAVVVATPALCPTGEPTPGNYAVLAGSAVTLDTSTIFGNVGIWPGIGSVPHYTGSTAGVHGSLDDANAAAHAGQNTKDAAYSYAFGLVGSAAIIPADLGGQTLPAGVYKSNATTFAITTGTLTLDDGGNTNAVWIFLSEDTSAASLVTGTNTKVVFKNPGDNPCNVFWQSAGSPALGVGSTFIGSIMASTAITVAGPGTTVNGRLLADTAAVTLDGVTVNGCTCLNEATP